MPRDPQQKLAFIAGGVGITPFRSMVKYLVDKNDRSATKSGMKENGNRKHHDVVLLYSNRTAAEIAYKNIFDEAAEKIGMKTVYAITKPEDGSPGTRITADLIRREVPDYRERIFYISGTHAMTTAFEKTLAEMNIPHSHIKIDFFPGFV
jgi:ferredoxin-NADP reductase